MAVAARSGRDDARRRELAAFLRACRAKVKPTDVGLPEGVNRRRTPGLRREEVAQVSGVGLTWYTWLEQARNIPASPQIIEALAKALQMDEDERRHLLMLAGLPAPTDELRQSPAAVQRMLDSLMPNPAYVIDQRFDIVAWNASQSALWVDPGRLAAEDRNLVWMLFTDESVRQLLSDWEETTRTVVAQFRAASGRHPDDPRYDLIASRLARQSEDFQRWWGEYAVAEFDVSVNHLNHPICGPIDLDLFHLRVAEHPNLTVVLQTPMTAHDSQRLRRILAMQSKLDPTTVS